MVREVTLPREERVTEREAMNANRRAQYAARRAASMQSSVSPIPPVAEVDQTPLGGKGDGTASGGE